MRRRVEDSVDAFLRNNNSTIRRISPEKMRNVLKNNLNKCPRISPKKGQKRPKNLHTQMSENILLLLPIFWKRTYVFFLITVFWSELFQGCGFGHYTLNLSRRIKIYYQHNMSRYFQYFIEISNIFPIFPSYISYSFNISQYTMIFFQFVPIYSIIAKDFCQYIWPIPQAWLFPLVKYRHKSLTVILDRFAIQLVEK